MANYYNRVLSKLFHFPEWLGDQIAKKKKDIRLKGFHEIATIGNNLCYREYNDMEEAKCEIYNSNSKESVRIGDYVKINGTLFCNKKGSISIGNYTVIRAGTEINVDNQVDIGSFCFISSDVLIYDNSGHPISPKLRKIQLQKLHKIPIDNYEADNAKIIINDDVWIGRNSIILKNVTIA